MQRAAIFTLLAASVLFAATVQAQRGGGTNRGGAGHAVVGSGVGGRPGFPPRNSRPHNFRNHALLYPLWWYDEPLDYQQPALPEESAPSGMMTQADKSRPAAPQIPAGPKITELPGTANPAASKPLPPALFILTNGERIEARQYLLSYDHVQLTVDRQQRTVPLAMLDINATLAADRQRGIDLRMPAGQSEISLGF
jgi:hypothetical protein